MQNNISNVSFKSNIRFIPYEQYERLSNIVSTNVVREMGEASQMQEIKFQGATQRIIYCLAGVYKDLNKQTSDIFHWYPDDLFKSWGKAEPNLLDIGKKIQETELSRKPKIFMIGGLSKACNREKSELSLKLFNFFKRHFGLDERDNFTMFFGQRNESRGRFWPRSSFVYSLKDDTYYVNSRFFGDTSDAFHDLLDKDEIKAHFDWIHVADDDRVFIGMKSKKPIENDFWNKSKLHKKVNILC